MSDDQWLRYHDFKIHSRHHDAEPRWIRNGAIYTQREALAEIARVERKLLHAKIDVRGPKK